MKIEQNKFNKNSYKEAPVFSYEKDSKVYKRIVVLVPEKIGEGSQFLHEYHLSAKENGKNVEVYLDCSKKKIFAKHIGLIFARSLYTVLKTLWCASVIFPLLLEIREVINGKQTLKELRQNTWNSIKDIGRTPFYGTLMVLAHIGGVILGCLRPNTLYQSREFVGILERKFLRVSNIKEALKDPVFLRKLPLSLCFSPLLIKENTTIEELVNEDLFDFADHQIDFKKYFRRPCNNCFRLLKEGKAYQSFPNYDNTTLLGKLKEEGILEE